jgi:Zn-finger nucleic acid-binding protein
MSVWSPADVEIDHCSHCHGLWFDGNELSRHLAAIGSGSFEVSPELGEDTSLSCPRCPAEHLVASLLLDVEVEVCCECHGTFLDLGELHELLGILDSPARASNPGSSLSGFDNFALGLFVGMRRGKKR